METTRTLQCSVCKEPYLIFSHYAGDQSACQECRSKAAKKIAEKYQKGK